MPKTIVSAETYSVNDLAVANGLIGNAIDNNNIVVKKVSIDPEMCGGNFWTAKTAFAFISAYSGGFSLDGFGYITGGLNGNTSNRVSSCYRFNDTSNAWAQVANVSATKSPSSLGIDSLKLNYGYFICGHDGTNYLSSTERYNASLNTWTAKPNHIYTNAGTCHVLNKYLYQCGGTTGTILSTNYRADEEIASFTAKQVMGFSSPRHSIFSFVLNGFAYVTGGITDTASQSDTRRYNDSTDAWEAMKSIPTTKCRAMSMNLNNLGYVGGGQSFASPTYTYLNEFIQYNEIENFWITKKNHPDKPFAGSGYELNGFGYFHLGFNGTSYLSSSYQYRDHASYKISGFFKSSSKDPKNVMVSTFINGIRKELPVQIRTNQGSADNDNWILGKSATKITKTGESLPTILAAYTSGLRNYEIKVGLPKYYLGVSGQYWVQKTIYPQSYLAPMGFSLNGFGYGVGGFTGSVNSSYVYSYNQSSNAWNSKANAPAALYGHFCASLNGMGYAFGGFSGGAINTIHQYNESTNAWATLSTVLNAAKYHPAYFTLNGYIFGGDGYGASASNEICRYDDTIGTFTYLVADTYRRYGLFTFSLNGYGYMAGGIDSASAYRSEMTKYNDATSTVSGVANLVYGVASDGPYGCGGIALSGFGYRIAGGTTTTKYKAYDQYNDLVNFWHGRAVFLGNELDYMGRWTIGKYGYVYSGRSAAYRNETYQLNTNENIKELVVGIEVEE